MDHQWLRWAKQLQAIAQNGLTYSKVEYDIERYKAVRAIAAEMVAEHTDAPAEEIVSLFSGEMDHATPKVDVRGVAFQGDSVLLCEEHGSDPQHTVSRYILEQTPLNLIVYDPRSNRLETVSDLAILDRIKVSTHVGYNVFGTASAFWQDRISALNEKAARRVQ